VPIKFAIEYKHTHLIQTLAQGSIYLYVGHFWPGIGPWLPKLLAQLVFANLFYFAFTLARENQIRIGLSMFPIVLSINLFLWFQPRFFWLHFVLIAVAIAAKQFWVRENRGKISHIFNPSALVMAGAALIVIVFDLDFMVKSSDLIYAYTGVPHLLPWIFAVGCISQWVGGVALVALGAFVALIAGEAMADFLIGSAFQGHWVHPSVFIGVTLLVTDPATTPKGKLAQFAYGCVYGLLIVPIAYLLSSTGNKSFYDKLLPVPILNYFMPQFERLKLSWEPQLTRVAVAAVYLAAFLAAYPVLLHKRNRPSYLKNMERESASIR
jgi:hypothetical protein